jgi:hypothetical protein
MADKYGLDWKVWGNSPKKPENKGFDPSATIGSNWGSFPKSIPEDEDYITQEPILHPSTISCTLRNARFLPDDTTNFNRPCKITVDVEGTPKGAIQFALWAKYKDIEYDLKHSQNAYEQDGKAQTELELYYVDEYYTDFYQKGEVEAKVEYFAKILNCAAREIKSELFTMPIAAPSNEFIEAYFTDKHGEVINAMDHGDKVVLVVNTKGMIGQMVDIDLGNEKFSYKSNDITIKNSIIKNLKISVNTTKIKLKVI